MLIVTTKILNKVIVITLNYDSFYKNFAGQTVSWLPMDTQALYLKNLQYNYDELLANGWINNNFTYTFNEYGFRCSSFQIKDNILFLGCSNTMGIGIPENDRWTNLVSNQLNLNCVNLGIGGSSCDTAFRLCYGYINKINPKIVIFLRPPGTRMEIVTKNSVENFSIGISSKEDFFINKWAVDENNNTFNYLKNNLAISYLCKQRNIKYLTFQEILITDRARDLVHPGINSNINFAKKVLSFI